MITFRIYGKIIVIIIFGTNPATVQSIILALCSGITKWRTQGAEMLGIKSGLTAYKVSSLFSLLSLF